ncbi:MAG: response regulator transcription factor [Anaerolineales bacterium]|nr:response regulator transcription factor [Anaerolineales bacterium]MCB0011352.1 response regulator transcription factor [Anaerolineales bacterium]MCB0016760.1 response regulator transcription factor [Anaerolineales bacterium]MCB0031454.1 response regulator transcription factor [Anaerolineales bacterium]
MWTEKQGDSNKPPVVRVVLADDHHVVRSGIRSELERHPDMAVVGEARDGQEALSLTIRHQPDVLLLDISMPGLRGMEVAERLSQMEPPKPLRRIWPPAILVLSAYCDSEYVYSLFAAGAKGYLLKDEAPERIVAAIRDVVKGLPALSLPVQQILLTRTTQVEHSLSEREVEVLRLMAKGFTNDQVAEELVIAKGTVKNHVTNIYRKLPNVRTRAEAVAWAWQNNLVSGRLD